MSGTPLSHYCTGAAYAQARANETRRAYIMTSLGHVWFDCRSNRMLAEELHTTVTRYSPQRKVQS